MEKQYEYLSLEVNSITKKMLNKKGKKGWKLAAVSEVEGLSKLIFIREKEIKL